MEDITTELKLKVAQLKRQKEDFEAECIGLLREKSIALASLKIENECYREKLKKVKFEIKKLYEAKRISPDEYAKALEVLSD